MHFHVIDLRVAVDRDLKKYFTGDQCKNGHIAERYTKKRACVACVRESSLRRSQTEKVKVQNKAYKQTAAYKAQAKEYKQNPWVKKAESERQKTKWRDDPDVRMRSLLSSRKNATKRNEYARNHYSENKKYYKEKMRAFIRENPTYFQAKNAKRRAAKKMRTPSWFSEYDTFVISEAFDLARERQNPTKIKWHVDHMAPLQSKTASGLHCAENIQVIPQYLNNHKGNKMMFTKPFEWMKKNAK